MKLKQRIIAAVLAVAMVVAFPMMAFAADSPATDKRTFETSQGAVIVDMTDAVGTIKADESFTIVDLGTPDPKLSGAATDVGANVIYFEAVHSLNAVLEKGSIVISFPVALNGVEYTIIQLTDDGELIYHKATSVGGYVSITVTKLCQFAVVTAASAPMGSASPVSPATGVY